MEKPPLTPRHSFLGSLPPKEKKGESFFTGRGVEPMPFVMLGIDYCNAENELEIDQKGNKQFLKRLHQNIHK